jgi:hypothetical protein
MIGGQTTVDNELFLQRLLELVVVNEEYFNKKPMPENETVPLTIKEIIRDLRPCEYECGANVTDQRSQAVRKLTPFPHWQQQCKNCGLFQHPATGRMVPFRDLNAYYTLFLQDNFRNV